mgnify:FL=1
MSFLELRGISKRYAGNDSDCLKGIDLKVERGEIIVILGMSGCGKTTILKIISGLEEQTSGSVWVEGECIDGVKPNNRPISMVFQKPLLFKNMTVEKNITFGKRIKNADKEDISKKLKLLLELMELEGLENRKPNQLSGGQEQRVSLARAIMTEPKILLLDEPMSALDAELRVNMRERILRVHKRLDQTILMVTHDQQEAVAMADKIALIMDGNIVQFGRPEEFYQRPRNKDVAMFFGWQNSIDCQMDGDRSISAIGEYEITGTDVTSKEALLLIRTDAVSVDNSGREAEIISSSFHGLNNIYTIACNGVILRIQLDAKYKFQHGDIIKVTFDANKMWAVER